MRWEPAQAAAHRPLRTSWEMTRSGEVMQTGELIREWAVVLMGSLEQGHTVSFGLYFNNFKNARFGLQYLSEPSSK